MSAEDGFGVRMQRWGGEQRWELLGPDAEPVPEAERFLHTLMVRGLSPRTRRTYAFDLLCAYRWMAEANRQPDQLTGDEAPRVHRVPTTSPAGCALHHQPAPAAAATLCRLPHRRPADHPALGVPEPCGEFSCAGPSGFGATQRTPPGGSPAQGCRSPRVLQQPQELARPSHHPVDVGRRACARWKCSTSPSRIWTSTT